MKEMIKKYKGTLICSVLVMLAGILVGFTMVQSIWINVFFVFFTYFPLRILASFMTTGTDSRAARL